MRILFVVDGRSPISMNWVSFFLDGNHEVHMVSTYPCPTDPRLVSFHVVPVAFASLAGEHGEPLHIEDRGDSIRLRHLIPAGFRMRMKQLLGPLTLHQAAVRLHHLIKQIRPDLVHAMRIPYEGMLAVRARPGVPLVISVWGNDFTLHAPSTPVMAALTRQTMRQTVALHIDCQRDKRLAQAWGLPPQAKTIVLPSGGGIQLDLFYPTDKSHDAQGNRELHNSERVINPRGFRAYIRNDIFFKAIPQVLARRPSVRFLCPAMKGIPQAERWVRDFGIGDAVQLLPKVARDEMAHLYRQAIVAVSPSTHDGTPNTLLEAMASGCFPIAGNIESLREWITDGVNGFLIDPGDPVALAEAILRAMDNPELRQSAERYNTRLVADKAEYRWVMGEAERFYRQIIENRNES
jgi:glycosyltransferase involved in cell wall biosynthesis